MGMAAELERLGGLDLLYAFANSHDLPEETMFEVKTDKNIPIVLTVLRLRKILGGAPIWENTVEGKVGKEEAGKAILERKIVKP